jgi:hypothetical protein
MNEDLPAPPIDHDVDCTGLPYMPLKVAALLNSELADLSTGAEFKAAVLLWCESWSQVPAGSLPSDERRLAKFAGVSIEEFPNISDMALRGWIKCNDGRIYHPVICDLAVVAWKNRRKQAENSAKRWASHNQAKMRSDQNPQPVGGDDQSRRKQKPIQGKVREGKVRESPLTPQTDPMGSDGKIALSTIIRVSKIGEKEFPITLGEALEAEEAGDNKNPAYLLPEEIRKKEVWAMTKGALALNGLDQKAAGVVIGEMVKKHGLDADDLARAAVIVWRAAPRSAKPYFVSVCERIALERRN